MNDVFSRYQALLKLNEEVKRAQNLSHQQLSVGALSIGPLGDDDHEIRYSGRVKPNPETPNSYSGVLDINEETFYQVNDDELDYVCKLVNVQAGRKLFSIDNPDPVYEKALAKSTEVYNKIVSSITQGKLLTKEELAMMKSADTLTESTEGLGNEPDSVTVEFVPNNNGVSSYLKIDQTNVVLDPNTVDYLKQSLNPFFQKMVEKVNQNLQTQLKEETKELFFLSSPLKLSQLHEFAEILVKKVSAKNQFRNRLTVDSFYKSLKGSLESQDYRTRYLNQTILDDVTHFFGEEDGEEWVHTLVVDSIFEAAGNHEKEHESENAEDEEPSR